MRIAFYNIENLFFRYHELTARKEESTMQKLISELDSLVRRSFKSTLDMTRIEELSELLGFDNKDQLRVGTLSGTGCALKYYEGYKSLQKASSKSRWKGWIQILNHPISEISISNKAHTIAQANADILLLQQIEDRYSLNEFNEKILTTYPFQNYSFSTVVTGNANNGTEQGVLLRDGLSVETIRSYHNSKDEHGKLLFDRNCVIYQINGATGQNIWVILAELQYPSNDKHRADEIRLRQSKLVVEIYQKLRQAGARYILLAGSFHTVPYCYSLAPLFNSGLKEIGRHPEFRSSEDIGRGKDYYSLGAYKKGLNLKQRDYLFLSPELYVKVQYCGLIRKGIWPGGKDGWPIYRNMKKITHQASSHPLLWMDLLF